ncbi:MAG: hypothetical protein B5M53_09405 [Candidatus Cloacimonas sp. 4484_209]|nr:MAG: hypothetical protein B5M53_09405 [Candidatus Cloacimonas sp. 4484_209]
MKLIVIGGVAAGMSAASKARRIMPEMEISVFEKTGYVSYGSCGLPYFIAGLIKEPEDLLAYPIDFFRKKRNIDVKIHHLVEKIEHKKKHIQVKDLSNNKTTIYTYDKLVIATGAHAGVPRGLNEKKEGVFMLRTVEDGILLRSFIKKNHLRKVVIVGAGNIGIEMVDVFHLLNMEITVVEKLPQVLPNLDGDMATLVEEHLKNYGVHIIKSTGVKTFTGEKIVTGVILEDETELKTDLVLIATGAFPSVSLAKDAGIEVGGFGGIKVNGKMETSLNDIYAAGDCIEVKHIITNKGTYLPLGTTANKTGRIAGENAAGGNAVFTGIAGTNILKTIDMEIAKTGLNTKEAEMEGYNSDSVLIKSLNRAHYYPGHKFIWLKIIFDKKTGKLLGAQIVGEGASQRIDIFTAAIYGKFTVKDLSRLDISYAPPFAPVWDPVLIAANNAIKKIINK